MSGDSHRKRRALLRRDGPGCHWCGSPDDSTMDHVIPRSMGGSGKLENLVLSCPPCNQARGGVHGAGSYAPGAPSRSKKTKAEVQAYLPVGEKVDEDVLQRKMKELAEKYKPEHERRTG